LVWASEMHTKTKLILLYVSNLEHRLFLISPLLPHYKLWVKKLLSWFCQAFSTLQSLEMLWKVCGLHEDNTMAAENNVLYEIFKSFRS